MRVSRITPVKIMPFNQVKSIIKYFSIKGAITQGVSQSNIDKMYGLQTLAEKPNYKSQLKQQSILRDVIAEGVENNYNQNLQDATPKEKATNSRIMYRNLKSIRDGSSVNIAKIMSKNEIISAVQTDNGHYDTAEEIKKDNAYSDEFDSTILNVMNPQKGETALDNYAKLLERAKEKDSDMLKTNSAKEDQKAIEKENEKKKKEKELLENEEKYLNSMIAN